uniref:Natural killer cell receptor 2B4 immunoglobulin domain-containing protein n=1 Tax=Cynoglossus semilaevis TaxID=244447 RepID=A0A3P8VAJ2_CYNSE
MVTYIHSPLSLPDLCHGHLCVPPSWTARPRGHSPQICQSTVDCFPPVLFSHLITSRPVLCNPGSKRDQFKWTFNNIEVIVTIYADNYTEQDDSYTDRAFISAENKSLLLKNTQNNDSGLYRAELQTRRNKCLVQYQVMVQDMVSRPNLVVTRVSSSSAHCDLNVTCSTADSELITNSVSCNSSDCSLQETETSRDTVSGAVLSLFLSHDNLVVCQLSNNVSQQRVTEEILQLCVTDSGRKRYYDVCHLSKSFCHYRHANEDCVSLPSED